jgi:hypothetical protein
MERREMKKLITVSFLALAVLATLAGCELYNAINVAWSIDSMMYNPVTYHTNVMYTVRNMGKVDLTGVNLQVGVDVLGIGTYPNRSWTPDFSLRQNQVLTGSVDVYTGSNPIGGATVISVDMDNPQG